MHSYIESNKERFLEELKELLRIPSVSTDPAHVPDMQRAAALVAKRLEEAGASAVRVMPTAKHPVVYGEVRVSDAVPTVLVYGHYDVQPADPVDEWTTPPFEPTVRDGKVYARGATDDKGQMYMHLKALELMQHEGAPACNLKFLIEGEEELGSPSLEAFCKEHHELLSADIVLASDTSIVSADIPGIEASLRGLVYFQVDVYGANTDLHSGIFGGAVPNPANALSAIIASLHDAKGRVAIPSFYNNVRTLTKKERAEIARAPHSDAAYRRQLGLRELVGEVGYSTVERSTVRPTLDVNGIWGGFTGEGSKTVIPREAHAKVSVRLVANQDPKEIEKLFLAHIKRVAPAGVRVETRRLDGAAYPYSMSADHIGYRAAELALQTTFRKKPLPLGSGGSIPVVPMFERLFGIKTVLMGFGLPTDNLHAPDEHFLLKNFYRGIETIPLFYKNLAELWTGEPSAPSTATRAKKKAKEASTKTKKQVR